MLFRSDTFCVRGDARKVGAVEDRALQGAGFDDRFFRLVMEGVVGGLGDNRPLARRFMRTRDEVSSANERA